MSDQQYFDPRLVALYDALSPPGPDTDFWVGLAGPDPQDVVDIGCGTGLLAIRLAELGHRVTGVDPAQPMLDVARRNDTASRVDWRQADGRSMQFGRTFDRAYMTGHVWQVFVDDADIEIVLRVVGAHLRPGGTLAFDTRNPDAAAWEHWTESESKRTIDVPGVGPVHVWQDVISVTGPVVEFETSHAFDSNSHGIVTSRSRLRFMDVDELRTAVGKRRFRRGRRPRRLGRWTGDGQFVRADRDRPPTIPLA